MSGINTVARICNYLILCYFNTKEKLLKWAQRVFASNNCIYRKFKVVAVWISEAYLVPIRLIRATKIHILVLYINILLKEGTRKVKSLSGIHSPDVYLGLPLASSPCDGVLQTVPIQGAGCRRLVASPDLLRSPPSSISYWTSSPPSSPRYLRYTPSEVPHLSPKVQETANELRNGIKEEPDYRHSSWFKASVAIAFVLLIYFGFKGAYEFEGYITDVYKPTRACMTNN